ncbi:MAG: adenylate/guanylate cyclase domain-containing protein, partial [Acidobacteria bacterium]
MAKWTWWTKWTEFGFCPLKSTTSMQSMLIAITARSWIIAAMLARLAVSRWVRWLFLSLGAAALAWAIASVGFFETLELKTLDYRFRLQAGSLTASPDIVIVEVDDASIKFLESEVGRWPWPRNVYAVLIDFMRQAGARTVLFDLLLTEADKQNPEADQDLGRATEEFGQVIHAASLGEQDMGEPDWKVVRQNSIEGQGAFPDYIGILLPTPAVRKHPRAIGHVAMRLDADGPWRRSLPLARFRDRLLPSLPLAAAMTVQGLELKNLKVTNRELGLGSIRVPLDEDFRLPIWFNGPPGAYRRYPFSHVFYSAIQLQEGEKPGVDPSAFSGKIVMIGVTATALHDLFTTPYSGSAATIGDSQKIFGKMPGVEVQANILDSLLHNRYLIPLSTASSAVVVTAVAGVCLGAVLFFPLWPAIVVLSLVPAGYLVSSHLAFGYHVQTPVVPVILAWAFALAIGYVYQYWIEGAEKRRIKRIFSHYVSRDVFHELLNNPSAAALGGKRTLATVLFSDLRGFTTLSEKTEPEALISQLNEYFSVMVEVVFEHRGTVDKFVGDMIMALFNVPLPDEGHADSAVRCAIAMQRRLEELNARWSTEGRCEFHSGVGVNTGDMIVGNVGSESIRSYTVIGDQVNLGSRLESLCKEHRVEVIISEHTRSLLKEDYPIQEIGNVVVKG